jgi:hypothetical protein
MPCALTRSFNLDCRDSFGGIKEIKIKVLPTDATLAADYTLTSGVIAIGSPSRTGWYTYQLTRNTSSFNPSSTASMENGTLVYKEELKVILLKLQASIMNELHLVSKNRLHVAIRTRNDDCWLLGYKNGVDLLTWTGSTGTASGDRSGYELTFTGEEAQPTATMTSGSYDGLITA